MATTLPLEMIAAVIATTIAIYLFNPTAKYLRLVDHPDDHRKLHDGSIPLTGGMSLFIALAIIFATTDLAAAGLTEAHDFWLITGLCLAILVMTHAIDDVIDLRAITRFAIDALLAFFLCLWAAVELNHLGELFGMGHVGLGRYALLMTIFCFIAASNAFNMSDGIDSLCSGLGILCFATLTVLILMGGAGAGHTVYEPALVVAAALVPMYLANLGVFGRRFKVFLGDSGARLIGFIAAIALIVAATQDLIRPVMAYFPIAVPVCDCLVLMGTRVLKGRSPLSADRLHLHHLLLDNGLSHAATRRLILALAGGFSMCGFAFELAGTPEWGVSIFVVVSFWCFIGLRVWLQWSAKRQPHAPPEPADATEAIRQT